jgi:DNA replication protein DnaC
MSLTQAFDTLEATDYKNFLTYYGIKIKNGEVNDLKSLIKKLNNEEQIENIFNQFYVSFEIPQIGKEFDLLRFEENSIINIELKSSSTEDTILKQLKRNKYYLNFIAERIYNFTFVSSENKLYRLNSNDELEEADFVCLTNLLCKQKLRDIKNINKLFNPSHYLVSPFNSTKKFVKDKYFLTQQQELVKTEITKALLDNSTANFFAVTGGAGTGKTLLTYDIAKKTISDKKKVLIIHCGTLNDGQNILNSQYNWKIIAIKHYSNYKLSNYDLIIIDEAQRIYPPQLKDIVRKIQTINGNCMFSYDQSQTLHISEYSNDINQKINDITSIMPHKLSKKIRTNKEIALFIQRLFDKTNNHSLSNKDNITLSYFNNDNNAKEFLEVLSEQNWNVILFTPSQCYPESHTEYSSLNTANSHKVIGQEFDNVAVVLDEHFSYNKENGKLIYTNKIYYDPVKMLFQNVTRTRKKLHIVIINNNKMLARCLSILS